MKNICKLFLFVLLASVMCVGCRGVSKYVDDAAKYVDDGIKKYKPKRASYPKDCPHCNNGYYIDFYGYEHECSFCDGRGYTIERL